MGLATLAATLQGDDYISIWKCIPPLVLLLIWCRLLTWADKDAPAAHLPRIGLNSGFLGGLVLGYLLFFTLPGFLVAFAVLFVIMAAEIGTYLILRQRRVGLGDLRGQFNAWLKGLFSKEKEVKVAAGQVMLIDKTGNAVAPPQDNSPDQLGYQSVQTALADPLKFGAEQLDMAPGETGYQVKYLVDGVPYGGAQLGKEAGAAAVTLLKATAGLDTKEVRKPQSGTFKAVVDGNKKEMKIQTSGTTAGEYFRLIDNPKKRYDFNLDTIGFTESQKKLIKESIADNTGVVLLTAPKTQGLTSLMTGVIRSHDAFLTHIHTIERDTEQDLEGITQNKIPSKATPAEEVKQVSWVVSQEPDAILMPSVENPKSAQELIKYAKDKRVYIGLRAANSFEALTAWRKLVGDDAAAMKNLAMIINGRVARKLCVACKIGYSPDPETLRKLNMDPDKVGKLYQARTEPMRDQKGNIVRCEFCNELRYKGRTGFYEILQIDDEIRQVVAAGGSSNQLRAAFRKQRGKYLQEQGLAMVEKGDTSVQEVLRVLKIGAEPSAGGGASGGGPSGGRPSSPKPTRPVAS